jgi:hypothetical protein
MALLSEPLKQRVRSFLIHEGATPSSQLRRNYDQIFTLLQRRREDDEFWTPLTELLRDLVDSVVHGKHADINARPEARLLALWDVNELAKWLRVALPHADEQEPTEADVSHQPRWAQLTRGLSPNALGLFLLLSLAASACDSPPDMGTVAATGGTATSRSSSVTGGQHTGGVGSSTGGVGSSTGGVGSSTGGVGSSTGGVGSSTGGQSSGTGGTASACTGTSHVTGDASGYALPSGCCASTASDLWNAIADSSLNANDKHSLYGCLVNLNANWCDGLVEVFKTATPTEIADYLNEMLTCCRVGKGSSLSGDFATRSQSLLSGMLCAVPLYKGVTFPD